MEKKTTDHGPIAYFCGIVVGGLIGYYSSQDNTWWQDALMAMAVFLTPLIWLPGPDKK